MSGRGKSRKSMELIDFAVDWFAENHPASVRACCYQLFIHGLIESMEKNETNKVSRLLRDAREQGLLPWEHVVDEARHLERSAQWSDPASRMREAVNSYRRDNWNEQPWRVEVWSEKGTIRGTLAHVLEEFGVAFRVMRGYSSATVLHDVAADSLCGDKPLAVLYLGDWDPSGLHMSEVDIPERFERYGGVMSFRRVALVQDDTAHLPSFDARTKAKDGRYNWFVAQHGFRCWELDAMSPIALRERVRTAITSRMNMDAWNHSRAIENAELESMRGFYQNVDSILRQASKYEVTP